MISITRLPRSHGMARMALCVALGMFGLASAVHAAVSYRSNQLEDLTWQEVRDRVAGGATTILVPIGGTEQSGPYIALGKHNVRVKFLADAIARRLGNALVAPVIAYVPEGSISPPAAHMRFAGTISISDSAFEAVLESAARSFRQHGFRDVIFLGDHGGYQKNEEQVAARLNREWSKDKRCRAHALLDYYRATQQAYVAALKRRGYTDGEIGTHAGLADTSLMMAVDKSLVRTEALAHSPRAGAQDGVYGDPRRATSQLGDLGVEQIIDASVSAIQALTHAAR